MKTRTPLLIIYLAAFGLVSGTALAEDKPGDVQATGNVPADEQTATEAQSVEAAATEEAAAETPPEDADKPATDRPAAEDLATEEGKSLTEEGELLVPVEIVSERILRDMELGIGYVSDDAYKFGRYNGMQEKGPFVIGDLNGRYFDEDGSYYNVRGTNLGLDSRYLLLEIGTQGSYKVFFEYDQLPNYKNNTVKSPFLGIGGDSLTLPTGFDIDNIAGDLNNFELETQRKRAKAGAMFIPAERWQFDVDFSHENKQGTDATSGAIANTTGSSPGMIGNLTFAALPEPIDQDTDEVNATLSYVGDDGQVDLKYHMSIFDNNYNSLTWQDPFNTAAFGSMSLAPDNEFHQLSLTGGYTLPHNTRLTGLFSMGRMTQNQSYLPYTVNTNASPSPLPQSSLDGEVWLTNAQLKLASRPVSRLRLNAELRYTERDNQTSSATYDYVRLDSDSFTNTATNRPISYKNTRIKLDANYRFNAISTLRGGYKFNEMKRSYTDAERDNTEENTLFAKWKVKAHSTVDVALLAEAGKRDGSDYNSLTNENPALRKYYLADRDRTKVGAIIDYMATDKLFLSAQVDYNKDDYTDSVIGLTEATQPVYTLDFSYQPRHNITTYGYYTYETIESSQAGSAAGTTTADWQADFEDTFDTIGLGAKWTDLGKWDLGADIVLSKSKGSSVMKDLSATPTNPGQYPDTRTELTSVKLWTDYNHSEQLIYKFGLWYEEYSADNWAIDGISVYDPTEVENGMLFGNETLDYDVYVLTASLSYRY
jgi:MtrB/PioB family decaheme-associated outer membrane protein